MPVPLKIYANFGCNLRGGESYEGSCTKSIKTTFLVVLLTKFFFVDDRLTKPIVVYSGENAA